MARERLEVDTGTVRSLADNLVTVRQSLNDAQASSDGLSGMVGHARLAGVIDDFSGKWDDRRRELVQQFDDLAKSAAAVADGFESVDSELARALTRES